MFSLFSKRTDSVKVFMCLLGLPLIWVASLILPHYQPNYKIPFLFLSACLFLILFLVIRLISFLNASMLFCLATLGFIFASEIVLLLLACFNTTEPYLFFSRLGSYSMFSNGQLMVFGDLRHLTSVVHCPVDIKVGIDICDIWGRHFNQNPDVGKFFRLSGFSNTELLGLLSTSIFFFIILILVGRFKLKFNFALIIFFTPPILLAIDRGNEIITISLILLAVLIADKRKRSNLTLYLLILASIFKFWPFILLVSWVILSKFFSIKRKILVLFASASYLIFHFNDLKQITFETQQGDANGGSFGIGLINVVSVYGWVSILLIFTGTILLLKVTNEQEESFISFLKENPIFVSLVVTYLGLFLTGIHFNYRLVILLPITILLWKDSQNMNLLIFIVALMITSRLNIISVTTTILFLYFASVLFKYLRNLIYKSRIDFL